LSDFAHATRLDVVDEAADFDAFGYQRGVLQELDVSEHVVFEIRKRQEVDVAHILAEILLDLRIEVRVVEREHAAVGVLHNHHRFRPEQPLRDDERPHRLGCPSAGVADHVRIALLEAEDPSRHDPRVHAGHDRHPAPGRQRGLLDLTERVREMPVRVHQLVDHRHRGAPPFPKWRSDDEIAATVAASVSPPSSSGEDHVGVRTHWSRPEYLTLLYHRAGDGNVAVRAQSRRLSTTPRGRVR
jgi:hypothetical protein